MVEPVAMPRRGAGSFLGQTTGLHSAAYQMFVRGLGGGILDAGNCS